MTATNHAVTGAVIGLLVGGPLIALPAAFLSHFVCDALPHSGNEDDPHWIKRKLFKQLLVLDALACIVLVVIIFILRPHDWFLACVCAFLATSPDLVWINHYRKENSGKKWKPSLFSKFASGIQWFQRPIGLVVEAVWLGCGIFMLATIIN